MVYLGGGREHGEKIEARVGREVRTRKGMEAGGERGVRGSRE